jgi:DNA-binding MarR family transcriptional regulator
MGRKIHKIRPFVAEAAAPVKSPLWTRPGFLVRRLHQIHSALFFEETRKFNITPVQFSLLTVLLHQSGSDQVTIASEVGLDRTNVADVLRRLTRRGLVRCQRSRLDRRSLVASLTDEGVKLTTRMHAAVLRAQERLLVPLEPAFQPAFMEMLLKLIEGNNQYSRVPLRSDFVQPRAEK